MFQKYQLAGLRRKQGYRRCFWSRVTTDGLLGTAIHMQIHPQPRFHCIPASSFDQLCCCGWAGLELFNASVCAGGDLRLMTRSYCKTLHMHVSWYIDNSSYICIYIYICLFNCIYIYTYISCTWQLPVIFGIVWRGLARLVQRLVVPDSPWKVSPQSKFQTEPLLRREKDMVHGNFKLSLESYEGV